MPFFSFCNPTLYKFKFEVLRERFGQIAERKTINPSNFYRECRCNVLILPRHNAAGSSIMAGYSATILPAARLWLPQHCRQQHRGCHNIAALALILLLGQDYGRHNIADGRIAAAITLLPAGSWQPQSCCLSKYYVRCTLSGWPNTWRALHSGFPCYIMWASRDFSSWYAGGNF